MQPHFYCLAKRLILPDPGKMYIPNHPDFDSAFVANREFLVWYTYIYSSASSINDYHRAQRNIINWRMSMVCILDE